MDQFQAEVIATCKEHKEQNWRKDDYRACVFVGENYFVKYDTKEDLEPELAIQEFIYNYAQQLQTPNPPRIAKIVHHFVDQRTMYLVMERITLQKSPPDLAKIEEAMKWLSEDFVAPFNFPNLGILDEYMKRAHGLLPVTAQQEVSPVSVSGERLMFTQSDMDDSNFGLDENGRTVLMDFNEIGLLPDTFVAHTLSSDKKFDPIIASLGLSGNPNRASMAAIAQCLVMVFNPKLGMAPVSSKI